MKKINVKDSVKSFFTSGMFQPVLTVILVGLMTILAIQLLSNRNQETNQIQTRQLSQKVPFDVAVDNYSNGIFNVLTNGSIYVKDQSSSSSVTNNTNPSTTTIPSITEIPIVENKYDNIFFILEKGVLKRVDTKSYGVNSSLFFNRKGEIIFLDNSNKQYTLYKIPDDSEKDAVTLFTSTNLAFKERLFPLSALINDYKEQKFNPIERAYNVYSGKWNNSIYTNGQTVDVAIEVDPATGVFSAMSIASTDPVSKIYFDFRKLDSINNYDVIPTDYKSIDVPKTYKTKE